MKAMLAALGFAMTAGVVYAEPLTLSCSGNQIVTSSEMRQDLTWQHDRTAVDFTFELVVDLDPPTVRMNGHEMVVRSISEDEVVFSTRKPGFFAVALDTPVYSLSRRTGAIRFSDGSGRCAVVTPERLF